MTKPELLQLETSLRTHFKQKCKKIRKTKFGTKKSGHKLSRTFSWSIKSSLFNATHEQIYALIWSPFDVREWEIERVCVCVCVCVCIHMSVCLCVRVHVCVCVCVRVHVYVAIRMGVCVCAGTSVCVWEHALRERKRERTHLFTAFDYRIFFLIFIF